MPRQFLAGILLVVPLAGGCGTTRVTDTARTATEQLLISKAVDEAVCGLDFRPLAGKTVFFDSCYLDGTVDQKYLISSLRQHLLASGALLQEERTKATYVVEARAGAIGTDRNGVLVGVPQMTVPTFIPGQPSQIPEIPLAKTTDLKGVAKVAVFAYNRTTGRPVMQSGVVQTSSTATDTWLLGMGPFQRGNIRDRTEFAGAPLHLPLFGEHEVDVAETATVPVIQAASWTEPTPSPGGGPAPGRAPLSGFGARPER
jgi:hypothetical protein